MVDGIRVIRYSLRDFWDEFVLLVALNILWSITAVLPVLPPLLLGNLPFLGTLALSLLLALPLPVVSGALCFITNQVARGKTPGWETFAYGLRRYWTKSLIVALINLVVLVVIATNLQFYAAVLQGTWIIFALSLWLVLGGYWLLVQIFWFPMILELENEKVLLALRNALAMVIVTPGFTIVLGISLLLLVVLCVVLTIPLVLVMVSLMLLISNHATRSRLAYAQKRGYRPGMEED